MVTSIPVKIGVGSLVWFVTTDKDKHPLLQMGRTAVIDKIIYSVNGRKIKQYVVRFHCTTGKDFTAFGSYESMYFAELGGYVGVLTEKVTVPQSYCGFVRQQATIR